MSYPTTLATNNSILLFLRVPYLIITRICESLLVVFLVPLLVVARSLCIYLQADYINCILKLAVLQPFYRSLSLSLCPL